MYDAREIPTFHRLYAIAMATGSCSPSHAENLTPCKLCHYGNLPDCSSDVAHSSTTLQRKWQFGMMVIQDYIMTTLHIVVVL